MGEQRLTTIKMASCPTGAPQQTSTPKHVGPSSILLHEDEDQNKENNTTNSKIPVLTKSQSQFHVPVPSKKPMVAPKPTHPSRKAKSVGERPSQIPAAMMDVTASPSAEGHDESAKMKEEEEKRIAQMTTFEFSKMT